MASRFHNISVDIGADYNANVFAYANGSSATVLNLSGYDSANAHVKKSYYHASSAAVFNVWIVDATAGIVNLHLNSANTITLSPGNYVYDVVVRNPSNAYKTRLYEGILTATAGVSR
jgi:hypothetical protein